MNSFFFACFVIKTRAERQLSRIRDQLFHSEHISPPKIVNNRLLRIVRALFSFCFRRTSQNLCKEFPFFFGHSVDTYMWIRLASMPVPLYQHSAVAINTDTTLLSMHADIQQ